MSALVLGMVTGESFVSTASVSNAAWFAVPNFVTP